MPVMKFKDALDYLSKKIGGNGKPRELLVKAMEALDNYNNKKEVIFLNAPTGYGKTTLSLAIYYAIKNGNRHLGSRIIHVLPLRSIGDQLYKKAICLWFPSCFVDIGLQHQNSPGSPMMSKTLTITTLDTFVMSLYKVPPYEMDKLKWGYNAHFDVSRGFIYTSIVVFDEAHLYFNENNKKVASSFIQTLKSLANINVPIIIMTATMPDSIINLIREKLSVIGASLNVIGPSASDIPKREIQVKTINKEDLMETIGKLIENGSLFIAANTVKQAYDIYKELKGKGYSSTLIHSRFSEEDRIEKLSNVIGGTNNELDKGTILVSTQVIEAGVDFSADFGISFSAPPENLIQRMGRIKRYGGKGEFYVVEPTDSDYKIYSKELVELGYSLARNNALDQKNINHNYYLRNRDLCLEMLLYNFDSNPFIGSKDVWEYIRNNCSLVREKDMVRVTPDSYAMCNKRNGEIVCKVNDINRLSFSMDYYLIKNYLMKKNKLYGLKFDANRKEYLAKDYYKEIKEIIAKNNQCISIFMMQEDIDSFLIEDYNKEVGYVG